jgi:hypothetical protein
MTEIDVQDAADVMQRILGLLPEAVQLKVIEEMRCRKIEQLAGPNLGVRLSDFRFRDDAGVELFTSMVVLRLVKDITGDNSAEGAAAILFQRYRNGSLLDYLDGLPGIMVQKEEDIETD